MNKNILQYKIEIEEELDHILSFWITRTQDVQYGGFTGRIDYHNAVDGNAPKGAVLNSRILWSFSAAFNVKNDTKYSQMADRAFHYLCDYFFDKEFGGVYWTVDKYGNRKDEKKQVYAQAFAIYGLSEYYRVFQERSALEHAINLYNLLQQHAYDKTYGGYIEALDRNWNELKDVRLSDKDANEKKSMNTHLHLIEGFAALYRIWPQIGLAKKLRELMEVFLNCIVDKKSDHLILFFDDKWNKRSHIVSYGHDIEAAWLLEEAAYIIGDNALLRKVRDMSVRISKAVIGGIDNDGGLWHEYDEREKRLLKEKHWWTQAECMVGFFNAWQITGDEKFLDRSLSSWHFIRQHIIDKKNGEWFWGINEYYETLYEDKAGIWKCPYHNSRACMEMIRRVGILKGEN